ncbi:hypothetical protein EPUS_00705 [Endocarpon pusillum Z07020]|uniref:NAD(P)-binding protein n=1 Tax=Endocarpon pusillum (strain Z07020 / HMAS-L-300199) TaxID=1263415 RepID=U1HV66_ENDPU|nr:uncharacterized protein EPUS_00705 [Endocarpon pusillum Z07020]ERF74575.1 hypothetical protein EPUS_00705 [Endocarpon pusillum Z07020]
MSQSLQEQYVNRGIGHAICRLIAENGPSGIVYASSRAGVDLALHSTRGVYFRYAILDLTNPSSIEHLAWIIKDEQGDMDVLFNVAGLNIMKPRTGSRAFADNKKIMDVNFHGTLQMCLAFLPIMKPGSRIQSAKGSRAAQDGWPESGYSVSKACINAMTAIMAREHADILVNACCPGWVSTEMGKQVGAQPPKSAIEGASIPLRLGFEDIGHVRGRYWANDFVGDTDNGRVQNW